MSADRPPAAGGEAVLPTLFRVAGLVALVYALTAATHPGGHGSHLAASVLLVATAGASVGWVVARRRDHLRASVVSLGALAVLGGALMAFSPLGVVILAVAALGAATLLELPRAAGIAAGGLVVATVAVALAGRSWAALGGAAAATMVGLAGGVMRRQQRERVEQAAQLALAEQRTELEHERAEVLLDRSRIAREVHDVLAHTLSALSVQMEALDSLIADGADPDTLHDTVRRSRRLVVEGLQETRRAVRVLRDEPVAVGEQIAALAADGGASVCVTGTPRSLPPAAGLALLRVAQESLTNARRHAPAAPVSITLTFEESTTSLVVDNGPGEARPAVTKIAGDGYGLRGMRERVELLGGRLTAGEKDGGWRVQAVVPA